ncbi:cytochrome [Rhodococcus sp. D-46]|uniref:cytochrome n=1 Tax=Rhodococcus sp. D-46 TaxID=2716265 RepID=UPI0013F67C82|nr:cytochrome [Rhodococcus sp. D-46]
MTTPKLSHQTAWGRMYGRFVGDEPQVPSITTVQGMDADDLPDPFSKLPELGVRPQGSALVGWRARLVQDATAAYLRNDEETLRNQFPHVIAARERAAARSRKPDAIARAVRGAIAATPDVVADQAAQRGDRVHNLAELLGEWQLGNIDRFEVDQARADLDEHGEGDYASALIDWWMRWNVKAVANEVTVWNHSIGVAGTLDTIFRIENHLYIGDFKTKSDRDGQAKPMQPKVGTQLVNGLHAQESVVDADRGVWTEWKYSRPDGLVAIAVSPTEVVPKLINPERYEQLWTKFCNNRRAWQDHHDLDMRDVLKPIRPPASAARWPDDLRVELPPVAA